MSKINLPELPPVPGEVIVDEDYDGGAVYGQDEDALRAWATTYAEQAVREALAAQEPVAWVMQVGMRQEFLPKSKVLLATSMGYQPKPLAIIPETRDG